MSDELKRAWVLLKKEKAITKKTNKKSKLLKIK